MLIQITDSWLREYLQTKATVKQIKDCLSLCGPSIEKITPFGQDYLYTIEITSNRVDLACVYGLAREACAILPRFGIAATLKNMQLASKSANILPELELIVKDRDSLCSRIMAVVMDNITVQNSPDFIRSRLEAAGIRSLNNIVDITNYCMLETGHPVHAFDYDRIKTGQLILRHAKKGEILITLDEKKYVLGDKDVVIDDGTGRIIDLPGIMGTRNSVIVKSTKRLVLFIEANNPAVIRRTSMKLGIRTMAAIINEKHPDAQLSETALLRGIKLYEDVVEAKKASPIIDIYPSKPKKSTIDLTTDFINDRLGVNLSLEEIEGILKSLHFDVRKNKDGLKVSPPSSRIHDVQIPEDLVEEVARIYGYHNLPGSLMTGMIVPRRKSALLVMEEKIKTALKYWGFNELYNYSFISKKTITDAGLNIKDCLEVANPLTADTQYMRTSLIPSTLHAVSKNQYLAQSLYFFELANIYLPVSSQLPTEQPSLVLASTTDFFSLKGIIQSLLEDLGIEKTQEKLSNHHFMHPQFTLSFIRNSEVLATVGVLKPEYKYNFNLSKNLVIGQLNIPSILKFSTSVKKFTPMPKFPPIIEDISFDLNISGRLGIIIDRLYALNKLINKIKVIDRYQNSVTLRLYYLHPEKTLSAWEVKSIRKQIVDLLKQEYDVDLRSGKS